MSNAQMILDQVDLVKLDINLWTSSKKLRAEDLVLVDGSRLPPEDLASLGTKKTIHPEKLKEFNRIKKEAERICLESGTRFIGGFANPRTEIPRITQQLDSLAKEFYAARDQFLASYTADTESWINAHTEFSEAIRRAVEPVESVASKLRFDYIVFRVTKPAPEQEASLERKALSMSEQLFKEIAQDASQIIDRSFVGKDIVTGRVLKAFRRMRDKLDSLGFLDFRCMPVVDEIDSVLDSLPKSGPYNGVVFHNLFRLGMLLSDPEKIKRHGSGLLQPVADLYPEPEEDVLDDQVIPESDFMLVEEELVQPSLPEVELSSEDTVLVEEPVIESQINDDDDIPGFDDYLAKYKPAEDVLDDVPSVQADVASVLDEDIIETLEAVIEAVIPVTPVPVVAPVKSVIEDNLGNDDDETFDESEELATAGDFWF